MNERARLILSYLQRFTPRRVIGTTSMRTRKLAAKLVREGRMTPVGSRALGID